MIVVAGRETNIVAVNQAKLQAVKARTWFYEFALPDGTLTQSNLPADWLPVHTSRRDHLLAVIDDHVPEAAVSSAIDLASHEGYFTVELAKRFASVRGFEYRPESIAAAELIADVLDVHNIEFVEADLQVMPFDESLCADFVLLYGLIYHLENPIHVIRLASQLARRHLLVETQVFPFEISGKIEDGGFENQRAVNGVFALSPDYASGREGGSTNFALIPSVNALQFLLRSFGFDEVRVLQPRAQDYEQYRRASRVIIYARKGTTSCPLS